MKYLSEAEMATFRQIVSEAELKNLNVKKISVALCVLLDNGKIRPKGEIDNIRRFPLLV